MNSTLKLLEKEYPVSINNFILCTGYSNINTLLNVSNVKLVELINLYSIKYNVQYTYSDGCLFILYNGTDEEFVRTGKYQMYCPLAGIEYLIRICKVIIMPTFNIMEVYYNILRYILDTLEYQHEQVEIINIKHDKFENPDELPF